MSRTSTVHAIVLQTTKFKDKDLFLTLFTQEFGKKRVMAKGAQSPQSKRRSFLEPFSFLKMSLFDQKIEIVTEVSSINLFPLLRSRFERTVIALTALEFIRELTVENQSEPKIFEDLLFLLFTLNTPTLSRSHGFELLEQFKKKLIKNLGFSSSNQTDVIISEIMQKPLRSPQLLQY